MLPASCEEDPLNRSFSNSFTWIAASNFSACDLHKGKATVSPLDKGICRVSVAGSDFSEQVTHSVRLDRNTRRRRLAVTLNSRAAVESASEVDRAGESPATRFDESVLAHYRHLAA
jgi:hypothetical protein